MKKLILGLALFTSISCLAETIKEAAIELCSQDLSDHFKEALDKEASKSNFSVKQSSFYRVSDWEHTDKSWNKERYPNYIKVPYYFVCVFNVETNEYYRFNKD